MIGIHTNSPLDKEINCPVRGAGTGVSAYQDLALSALTSPRASSSASVRTASRMAWQVGDAFASVRADGPSQQCFRDIGFEARQTR